MKLESDSAPRPSKWRLSRTLRRKTEFRPIETDDLKYLWAAYKQGGLKEIGFTEDDLTPDDFRNKCSDLFVNHVSAVWVLLGESRNSFLPVGIVLAVWAPGNTHLVVMDITWMPWASKRNIVESCVGFFNKARKEFNFMGYALPEHKRMYEVCAAHGAVRRVGTSYVVIPGKAVAVFESRKPH